MALELFPPGIGWVGIVVAVLIALAVGGLLRLMTAAARTKRNREG